MMQLSVLHEAFDWKKFGKGAGLGAALGGAALTVGNLVNDHRPSVNRVVHTDSRSSDNPLPTSKFIVPGQKSAQAHEVPPPMFASVATPPATPPQVPSPHDITLNKFFGDELPIIKKAADRNNCTGDLFNVLLAIRKSENGTTHQFGILKAGTEGLDKQAGWAASTIVKNYAKWKASGSKQDFISYLSTVYCPIGASNDPTGLNANWVRNVTKWYRQLK